MSLFDRYMARHILAATAMVLLVILFLDAFFGFLGEGKYVARYDEYSYWHALGYVMLRVPGKAMEFMPAITLIGALLGLGALASNSELTAMRAAGLSKGRIVWGGIKTGLLIALGVLLLSDYVAPKSELRAAAFRAQSQGKAITAELRDFWIKEGSAFVNIRRAEHGQRLRDVRVFEVSEGQLNRLINIDQAQFIGERWRLDGVTTYRFDGRQVERRRDDTLYRNSVVDPSLFEVARLSPENMRMFELHRYIQYLDANALDATLYRKAFWKKVTAPLSILVMLLLAMPFVFANRRSGNAGSRLVIGILFGMSYYIISSLIENLGQVYGVPVLVGAFAPIAAFTILGFWLLKRSEG
ncbi:MAG: LPS export ABC transporter permease LptG [Pseudomonadota bacterium]